MTTFPGGVAEVALASAQSLTGAVGLQELFQKQCSGQAFQTWAGFQDFSSQCRAVLFLPGPPSPSHS